MIDERIKEECYKWFRADLTEDEKDLYDSVEEGNSTEVLSFYAGFKTAERLAKIEVLEDLFTWVDNNISPENAFGERCEIFKELSGRISELKEVKS